ncbi:MAG: toxin [Alkalinema sp. CAN_BIN05]|nr:toxin [Alkalinema sp. CAN_BIN05]
MAMSEDVKPFRWNDKKNIQLQAEREINFEMAVSAITEGNVLDVIEHPNQEKYPSQRVFVIRINQYVYLVPFVENDREIFLKTIIPSRKMKKKYLGD